MKAIAASDPSNAEVKLAEEYSWQLEHLPEHLREDMMKRIKIVKKSKKWLVTLQKDSGC